MRMITLRIFSHGLGAQVLESTTLMEDFDKLEKVEQTFNISTPNSDDVDTVTLQLEFDPPLNILDDEPPPLPE
jgi:hypothetical protein